MSKDFDNLVSRVNCQMKVMLRERGRFNVLAKELETLTKRGITDRQYNNKRGASTGKG